LKNILTRDIYLVNVLDILYFGMLCPGIVMDKNSFKTNLSMKKNIVMIVIMTLTIESFRKSDFGDLFFIT
jgi:hypothetical protein